MASEKLLAKAKAFPDLVSGQLLTPLTRYKRAEGVPFAIDNGAFSRFLHNDFAALLKRESEHKSECLFVCVPDVVESARRTLEVFRNWSWKLNGWPIALVAQDGMEHYDIPWSDIQAIFIGGSTDWKESKHVEHIIKTALILEKHVHIGRVNTIRRFRKFEAMGAHTCDGSGVARFDWMLEAIAKGKQDDQGELFDEVA